MPRRRRGREANPPGGVDADHEIQFRSVWGLEPDQWRPVGSMALVRDRAVLLWRPDGSPLSDIALRARRAYDRLGELGVTTSADATREGIEVTVPLNRVAIALRILGDRSILPDAVMVANTSAEDLRALRREITAHRRRIELVIGHEGTPDPIATLQARVRAG